MLKTYREISTGKLYCAHGAFALLKMVAAEDGISAPVWRGTVRHGVTTVLGRRFEEAPTVAAPVVAGLSGRLS